MTDLIEYKMLINGTWVKSSDGKTFDSKNPTSGAVWCSVPEATEKDVNRAVEAAYDAFESGPWSRMTPTERGDCLRRLADVLASKSEELGRIETIDTGKMLKETKWQAKYISQFFNFFAGCADKVSGDTLPIDKAERWFLDQGISWSKSPNSKNFIRINSGLRKILSSQIHLKGKVFVQNRASGAVVEILNPKPNETILDVCAAPGTKSIYIFQKMNQSGNLFASDINSSQVAKSFKRCSELELSIDWKVKDATKDIFPMADRILIDAPCTGTGVISRKPDIKWRKDSKDPSKMSAYQIKILFHISKFLKTNGVIVYATCSMENQENWNVIDSFLKLNSNYKLESIDNLAPREWINKKNCLETFPPRDHVDGMFAARIRKC